MYIIINS